MINHKYDHIVFNNKKQKIYRIYLFINLINIYTIIMNIFFYSLNIVLLQIPKEINLSKKMFKIKRIELSKGRDLVQ